MPARPHEVPAHFIPAPSHHVSSLRAQTCLMAPCIISLHLGWATCRCSALHIVHNYPFHLLLAATLILVTTLGGGTRLPALQPVHCTHLGFPSSSGSDPPADEAPAEDAWSRWPSFRSYQQPGSKPKRLWGTASSTGARRQTTRRTILGTRFVQPALKPAGRQFHKSRIRNGRGSLPSVKLSSRNAAALPIICVIPFHYGM